MDDLIERLREEYTILSSGTEVVGRVLPYNLASAAADRITALEAENARLREAAEDALAGWRYIRAHHGDLYGVGWDRVEQGLAATLKNKDKSNG